MRKLILAILASALVTPAPATAGLVLGLGTGLIVPTGSIGGQDKMQDAVSVMIPVELQAGWKFSNQLTVAGFFAMDLGFVGGRFKDSCDATGEDCYANLARFGVQGRWNFQPTRRLDPWVGLGVAHETLALERSTSSSGSSVNMKGLAVDAMAGVDYWLGDHFGMSPWLGLSVGKFTDVKNVDVFDSSWLTIPDQKLHALVTAGVRLTWEFGAAPRAE